MENYVSLKLVNPYFIKQLPGKKSDVKDAEWIATCLLKDLIKGSYVPEDLIPQLRQYDRCISDLNAECVRKLGKLDAALQRCNIRISNYVSTTDGKSYKEVVRLISEGIRDHAELSKVIHGRIVNRVGNGVVIASLAGVISDTDIDVIFRMQIIFAIPPIFHFRRCWGNPFPFFKVTKFLLLYQSNCCVIIGHFRQLNLVQYEI